MRNMPDGWTTVRTAGGCVMVWKVMMVSLAGGLLCLDRTSIQMMISRPVVAGPLVGWLLGDPFTGLLCGALIELIWIDRLPIGNYIPPNETLTTVIIAATAILAGTYLRNTPRELVLFALLVFLPLGYAGRRLDMWIVRSNEGLAKRAAGLAATPDVRGIERQHLRALLKTFTLSALFIFLAVALGSWLLIAVFPVLPSAVLKALTLSGYLVPLLGIAVALTTIKRRGAVGLFCAIFVAMLLILEWTYGLFG